MDYQGVIIEESLGDTSVLEDVKIIGTKVEKVTSKHKTPWVEKWTLHTVEIPEEKADKIAEKISQSFDPEHLVWYADFQNDKFHFIVYPEKIFKVDLKNPKLYKDAKKYGMSLGIPDYQVDFAPEDEVWER